MSNEKYAGSTFDSFLEEDGLLDECSSTASKRVLAWCLGQEMEKINLSKSELARRMKTSRSSVNRLLDPTNTSISLATMEKAARALGKKLEIQIA